jgi:hypothetical protein
LTRGAKLEPDDDVGTKLGKLEALLALSGRRSDEDVALFSALLSIPTGDRVPLPSRRSSSRSKPIARALETQYRNLAADELATLAHHYTEAGLIDQAIPTR